jgi:nucleotide-binding universal stress UspA family protein
MNLKDILVFLDAGAAGEERLRLAMQMARDHQAYLSAAFLLDPAAGSPSNQGGTGFGSAASPLIVSATDISPSAMRAETAEQQFRDAVRALHAQGDWYPMERSDTAGLITLAQAADLIIIGQVNPHARLGPAWRPEEIVLACGRPVLMIPYIGSFAAIGRRVLIAWDGSREAVRALNDALPLIGAAEIVTVMAVHSRERDFERDRLPMARIVGHLARHGIAAHAVETVRTNIAISDVLLSSAADLSADLIVAGAYHHSPLREILTGGVSRELFQHMTVPVLMSH